MEAWCRLSAWMLVTSLREALGRLGDVLVRDPTQRVDRMNARHRRSADRLARHLAALKGVFVKAGQFAAMRRDILPEAIRAPLKILHDRVKPLPFSIVQEEFERAMGVSIEVAFVHFDRDALGAASIAQVHRARTHEGTDVAVKIQYPWLARAIESDLRLLRRLLGAWNRSGAPGDFDPGRLIAEFERGIREELDFEREARIATEIAANLEREPGIVVPHVIPSLSGSTVLTVEYRDVVRLEDDEALDRLGVERARLVEILGRAYAKQIFVDGLFHADPHPGNLFVLDEPSAADRPRILFVDFGLSQHLDDEIRRQLRAALLAMLQRDPEALIEQMDRLGMIRAGARPAVERAVDAMFEHLSTTLGRAGVIAASGTQIVGFKDLAVRMLEDTPGLQLPIDLLLYARTLSYLFALAHQLDPDVDMMKVVLPSILRFLAERD